jgi:F0F1-type ATP synthase membrane subunit a
VLFLANTLFTTFLAGLIIFLISGILCLELFIGALQAYVFVNLASVYLDQSLAFLAH